MKQVKAVVENGYLKPVEKLNFPDGEKINLLIYTEDDMERIGWLKLSEKAFEFWNNEADEAWNEL